MIKDKKHYSSDSTLIDRIGLIELEYFFQCIGTARTLLHQLVLSIELVTVQTGTGKVDPARKFKCTIAARDCKTTVHVQRWQCPIHNGTRSIFVWSSMNVYSFKSRLFSSIVSLQKTCVFLLQENKIELSELNHGVHVLKVPLWIGHCHHCRNCLLKSCLQSL